MSEQDGQLRDALRDLIPGYTGPEDPLPRVVASVRRRRTRQRVLLAVGGAGTAAAVMLAGPVLLVPTGDGGTRAGSAPPAPAPAVPAPTVPAPTGTPGTPGPAPQVFPVAEGTVDGVGWRTGSVRVGPGATRCVFSDDALGDDELLCFHTWDGTGADWEAVKSRPGAVRATRLIGVTVPEATTVRIRLDDGAVVTADAVAAPFDGRADFFAVAVPGTRTVRSVTLLDRAGRQVGPVLTGPGTAPCRPGPNVARAVPD